MKPMYIFCLRGDLNLQFKKKINNLQIKLLQMLFRNCKTKKSNLLGQSHPSLLISTLSWQLDCREAGDFSYNKVDTKVGPTNV